MARQLTERELRYNPVRLAVLEAKISDYRQSMSRLDKNHWLYSHYKARLDKAIIEYQERQLIEEQQKDRRSERGER